MSPIDMTTETGRMILRDLIHFKETGFSPFSRESYESENFWRSREEYQKVPLGAFKAQAGRLAKIAVAQMPSAEKKMLEKKKTGGIGRKKGKESLPAAISTDSPIRQPSSLQKHARVQSLRDTIVVPYPNNEMAIVIFELDGDVKDATAFQLQFSQTGQQISIFFRVPKELTSAESLLGKKKGRGKIQDADCMLLEQVIKKRLNGSVKDNRGDLWETRVMVDLPFRCKKCLFNKHGEVMVSFLLRTNAQGYGWGYFWVVGEHVGQREEYPATIRCEETSDIDSDGDQNSSQCDSSDDEHEKMSVELADDSMDSNTFEAKTDKTIRLTNDLETEIQRLKLQLEVAAKEATNLREKNEMEKASRLQLTNEFETETQKLKHQLEAARKEATHIREDNEKEKANLLIDVDRLQQRLDAQLEEEASRNNWYTKESSTQNKKIQELEKKCRLEVKEHEKNLERQRQQIQQLQGEIERLNEEQKSEICRVHDKTNFLLNEWQAKENNYMKNFESQKNQICKLEGIVLQKNTEHEKQMLLLKERSQTLEQTVQRSLVELASHHCEKQKQREEYTYHLETQQRKILNLEQDLLQKNQRCCDQMIEIDMHKTHTAHQLSCIRKLKIALKEHQECINCGLKFVPNKPLQKFSTETKEKSFFDRQGLGCIRDAQLACQNEVQERYSVNVSEINLPCQIDGDEFTVDSLPADTDQADGQAVELGEIGAATSASESSRDESVQVATNDVPHDEISSEDKQPGESDQVPDDEKSSEDQQPEVSNFKGFLVPKNDEDNCEHTSGNTERGKVNLSVLASLPVSLAVSLGKSEHDGFTVADFVAEDEQPEEKSEGFGHFDFASSSSTVDTFHLVDKVVPNDMKNFEEQQPGQFDTQKTAEIGGFLEKQPTTDKLCRPRKLHFCGRSSLPSKQRLPRKKVRTENREETFPLKTDEQYMKEQRKKRKSSEFIAIKDSEVNLPNKKLRRSTRLEERRLGGVKKTKTD